MVEIRWAELKDMTAINRLFRRSKPVIGRSSTAYPFTEWIVNNERLLLVAESGKKLVGLVTVRPKGEESSIDVFCYDKRSKAQNMKEELLAKAEDLVDSRRMTVFVPKGDPLVKFFKKQGYEVYDEINDLYGNRKHAYLMVKDIAKGPRFKIIRKNTAKGKRQKKTDKFLDENLEKLDAYLDF